MKVTGGGHRFWAAAITLAVGSASGSAQELCEVAGFHPWVAGAIEHTREADSLYRFALEAFGPPVACEGRVAGEFDGVSFGEVDFRFRGDVTLTVETMPPLVRIVTLAQAGGFADPERIQEAARSYAAESGFLIHWSEPEVTAAGESVSEQFRDPEPGLNASVVFTRESGRLISIRISSAP